MMQRHTVAALHVPLVTAVLVMFACPPMATAWSVQDLVHSWSDKVTDVRQRLVGLTGDELEQVRRTKLGLPKG